MSTIRRTDEARRPCEADRLALLADISDSAIAYLDRSLCFEMVNRAFDRRFGSPSSQVTAGGFFDGKCSPAIDDYLANVLNSSAALSVRLDCLGSDGRSDRLRLQAVPYLVDDHVAGLFICFEALERRPLPSDTAPGASPAARAQHLERMARLGEMSAGIAHEIRQPLAAITNYASALTRLLRAGRRGDQIGDLVERISDQARRADRIIGSARSLVGQVKEPVQRFDVLHVIDDSTTRVEPRARKLGVDIRLGEVRALPSVYGNAPQIEQILVNLLNNAIDALAETRAECAHACPTVRIETGLDDATRRLKLFVRDNGPGIEPTRLGTIFDAFDTSKRDGMGMGLSISKALAEHHGGSLRAHNEPTGGACFVLELPLASTPRAEDPPG